MLPATPGFQKPVIEDANWTDTEFQTNFSPTNHNRNTTTLNAGITNELALIKEKSGFKEGPSSTIMPTATPTKQDQADQLIVDRKKEQLINLVKGRSARGLKAFLDSEVKGIDLMQVEDESGYSLLHLAAFKKIIGISKNILEKQTEFFGNP